MHKRILFLALALFIASSGVFSQGTGTISGFVYDKETGEGLVGANVFLKDTYYGAATNANGYYALPKIPAGTHTLVCQYMGYESFSKTIKIKSGSKLEQNIQLEPTTILTEEISVVADSARTSVKLYRKSISSIKMDPRQIKNAPQVVESDLLRSLQTMPGIAAVSDFSSELYVRGGTPDQNLYMIDGTDVYNPEHLFGLFSTFNTDAIKNVEISKGGFGAEYGGRLSSVLDVTNLDGNRREYTGKTSISLLSAKTTMQVPIGKIGALSGSFRRTYFDQTIAKLDQFKDENIPDYYFYDGHLKAFFDINQRNKLTLSFYKSYDDLDFIFDDENPDSEEFNYDWGNTTASLRWTHIFSPSLFGNFWATTSSFDSYFEFGEDINEENDMDDRTLKGNLEYYYSQNLNFKLGFEYKYLKGIYTSLFPGGEVDVRQSPQHFASYIQAEWSPSPLVQFTSGLRLNTAHNEVYLQDLDPRFSVKYRLTETMNLKGAFGRYHQYLFKIPRAFITDIWSSSDQYYDDAKANHYILGFQKEVAQNYQFEIETYYKNYDNIYYYDPFFWTDLRTDKYNNEGEPLYTESKGLFTQGKSKTYGLEVLLRKDRGAVTGWISYTLGRALYTIQGVNQNQEFTPRHDRTSILNVVGNIDVKNLLRQIRGNPFENDKSKWKIGFGLSYASGQPITIPSYVYTARQMPDQDFYHGYNLGPIEKNNFRLPAYIRFDFSVTFTKKFKSFTLEPFLHIFNATNRRNVWFINYDENFTNNQITQEIDPTYMLPVLPSLGVNIIF